MISGKVAHKNRITDPLMRNDAGVRRERPVIRQKAEKKKGGKGVSGGLMGSATMRGEKE